MPLESILYILFSNTATAISLVVAFLFWYRRNARGAMCMTSIMSVVACWTITDLLSVLNVSFPIKSFWYHIGYIGAAVIPVLWIAFVLQYTKREKYLSFKNVALLSIVPALTLIIMWTNSFHHLFEVKIDIAQVGVLTAMCPVYGDWFWVHALYSYALMFFGTVLLFKKHAGMPRAQSSRYIFMVAVLIPLGGSILYTFGISPSYPVDPTVFSFSITGIFFFLGTFRFRLFELVPAARGAVIESMDEPIIVLDNKNHIADINSAAKRAFGSGGRELTGEPVPRDLGEWSLLFERYMSTERTAEKITLTDGSKKHFDLRIAPLYDNNNKLSGRYYIMHDITALEEAIRNLEEARKTAEDANKAKSRFLAAMSHEIRTPLNGIIGMAELLASADLTEEERGYLLSVQDCSRSLLGIINDILDFSKIEAGRMEIEETAFNVRELVGDAVKPFQHQKSEKDIRFVNKIAGDIPESLVGDPVRLRQVLVNLISNAFKFTEKGRIEVQAGRLRDDNGRIVLGFSVTDTGIGIPEDKMSSLFKSFQQLDASTTRIYGGTGLGLAIVKNLITMMGGSIEVESKPGEGSRFFFTIPFRMAEKCNAHSESEEGADLLNNSIRVLLAEDNKVNQALMVKILEKKNLRVDVADNGKKVLEKLDEVAYDLILMDIQMPEMDGYEATLEIRKNEVGTAKHIPIIALTANATEEDRKRCLQTGMDDYLSKPIRSEKLFDCMKKYVS